MDGLSLLRMAWAAGLTVEADGERLRIRGPRQAEPIAQELIAHKAAVLTALTFPPAPCVRVEDLDPVWRVEWEECAAVMEHDGGLPRERAEAVALAEVVEQMRMDCHACVEPK